jgi:hypothetical protein
VPAAQVCRSFAPVWRTRAVVLRQALLRDQRRLVDERAGDVRAGDRSASSADLNQIGPPPIHVKMCFVWW